MWRGRGGLFQCAISGWGDDVLAVRSGLMGQETAELIVLPREAFGSGAKDAQMVGDGEGPNSGQMPEARVLKFRALDALGGHPLLCLGASDIAVGASSGPD